MTTICNCNKSAIRSSKISFNLRSILHLIFDRHQSFFYKNSTLYVCFRYIVMSINPNFNPTNAYSKTEYSFDNFLYMKQSSYATAQTGTVLKVSVI